MMQTVELLDELLDVARGLGYQIRHEWLGGGGGACEFAGRKWLFIDVAQNSTENLEDVRQALLNDPAFSAQQLSANVSAYFGWRRAA